ncbi:MAG: hypothetical protein HOM68_02755 [Gemmatimonadetes bacterium]|nr:hypothetical protein [Gemmatimonadota bacterium]MBT4612936.1 hypothetical protein [Gemmatimonadota bacterium]MBT5055438.1 hypothetical protein [Gemmatimonadota bacterium]MBT5143442.1 hypothetical protein [Gemmatimonadota bacterium]MBT5589350.1 hypothetical protein [Gemmatimonadota bacterium]
MILLIPTILSALLLGAHFLRDGQWILVVVWLLLPLLLIPRRRALLRGLQGAFVLGALEWLRTLAMMVQVRWAFDEPWIRLVVILGAVATFTLATAWWLRHWTVNDEPSSDLSQHDTT